MDSVLAEVRQSHSQSHDPMCPTYLFLQLKKITEPTDTKKQSQKIGYNKSFFRPSNPVFDNTIGENNEPSQPERKSSVGEKKKAAKQQNQYQFTPKDIKFDNKHYKYLKYTAMNGNGAADTSSPFKVEENTHKYRIYNANKSSQKVDAAAVECKATQLTAIGNRLLDWFSVIMADSKKRRQHSSKPKGILFAPTPFILWLMAAFLLRSNKYNSLRPLPTDLYDRVKVDVRPFGLEQRRTPLGPGAVRPGARPERELHQAIHRRLHEGPAEQDDSVGMVSLLREDG